MDKPLRLTANRFVGVLVGLCPVCVVFVFLLFALFFRWRNASLAGGFAGRRVGWFLWLCVVLSICLPHWT